MNLFQRIKNDLTAIPILKDWIGDGGICVDQELAQSRANTCLHMLNGEPCPNHSTDWKFETAIGNEIKRQIEVKNSLQLRVEGEKSLVACKGCGCALRLKVWIPVARIRPDEEESKNFHPKCWMLTEP
jgi:hypothetical protein